MDTTPKKPTESSSGSSSTTTSSGSSSSSASSSSSSARKPRYSSTVTGSGSVFDNATEFSHTKDLRKNDIKLRLDKLSNASLDSVLLDNGSNASSSLSQSSTAQNASSSAAQPSTLNNFSNGQPLTARLYQSKTTPRTTRSLNLKTKKQLNSTISSLAEVSTPFLTNKTKTSDQDDRDSDDEDQSSSFSKSSKTQKRKTQSQAQQLQQQQMMQQRRIAAQKSSLLDSKSQNTFVFRHVSKDLKQKASSRSRPASKVSKPHQVCSHFSFSFFF
eukprot:TRINITY_DN356_c0_g2_i1.p1 TRINITY_DN356_c0_g2~~TRINITY_DN356_c0_g2_i1.p1  ORF type:complete len:280 (-),score=60.35 TRINITY_DN356_c0_g2_i1:191-1006(-)